MSSNAQTYESGMQAGGAAGAAAPVKAGFNYIFGLVNLAVVFCLVWLLWYVFMHPDGVMKLYTPMYGFSLVAVLAASIILLTKVIGWPKELDQALPSGVALSRGIAGTILALVLMLVVYYLVFRGFLGRLGIAYFSPDALIAGGGTGAEPWNAREWSSTAILYFSTAVMWWALAWDLGFGEWPWQDNKPAVQAFSRLCAVLFLSGLTFFVLFHPHVCMLFPQAQSMAGVKPWWEGWAQTTSAFYGLGVVLCSLFWIVYSDLFWEGRPWSLLGKDGEGSLARGIVTFIGTLLLGLVLMYVLTQIYNAIWMEPYQGGQYTDGPDWRYIHMGELSGFCILAAFIWKTYFNNFPNHLPLVARAVVRSLIGVGGGLLIYWFYYSPASKVVLGKLEGWGQPDDQPLIWILLFLSVVMIQGSFFAGWPLKTGAKE